MKERNAAKELVRRMLNFMELRELETADSLMAPGAVLIFPGGQQYGSQAEMAAAARGRYRWVRKAIDRTEAWQDGATVVVYVLGSLYGENRHGVLFSGVRFVDRFEVQDGRIHRQEVWNDLAETGVLERTDA